MRYFLEISTPLLELPKNMGLWTCPRKVSVDLALQSPFFYCLVWKIYHSEIMISYPATEPILYSTDSEDNMCANWLCLLSIFMEIAYAYKMFPNHTYLKRNTCKRGNFNDSIAKSFTMGKYEFVNIEFGPLAFQIGIMYECKGVFLFILMICPSAGIVILKTLASLKCRQVPKETTAFLTEHKWHHYS